MSELEIIRTAITALWRITPINSLNGRKLSALKDCADRAHTLDDMRRMVRAMDAVLGSERDFDRMLLQIETERV